MRSLARFENPPAPCRFGYRDGDAGQRRYSAYHSPVVRHLVVQCAVEPGCVTRVMFASAGTGEFGSLHGSRVRLTRPRFKPEEARSNKDNTSVSGRAVQRVVPRRRSSAQSVFVCPVDSTRIAAVSCIFVVSRRRPCLDNLGGATLDFGWMFANDVHMPSRLLFVFFARPQRRWWASSDAGSSCAAHPRACAV